MPAAPLKAFIVYAHQDKKHKEDFDKHLRQLVMYGLIDRVWSDKEIMPGEEWDAAIKRNLQSAELILLLVSVDFFNSEYIQSTEFKIAVNKHEEGKSILIPVIVESCLWHRHPVISKLEVLPKGGKAIGDPTHWPKTSIAWDNVTSRLAEMVEVKMEAFAQQKAKAQEEAIEWYNKGLVEKDPDKKIEFYTKAIELDPDYWKAYYSRGWVKHESKNQHQDAILDFDRAIQLNPDYADAYTNRGRAKRFLKKYTEAINDYDQSILLKPEDALNYNNRGYVKYLLNQIDAAKLDFQTSLKYDPNLKYPYVNLGYIFLDENQFKKAEEYFLSAIALDSEYDYAKQGLEKARAKK